MDEAGGTIEAMQKGLQHALERASQSDDRELAGRVREEGRRLVFLLNGLIRTCHVHELNNEAFQAPAKEFAAVLEDLIELLGVVHVICVEDQIYVSDVRLRINPREQPNADNLVHEMANHRVGGISFHAPITGEEAKTLALALASPPKDPEHPRASLALELSEIGMIELIGMQRFKIGGEDSVKKHDYKEAMERAKSAVHEAMMNVAANRLPNPLPVRRAVIDLVNNLKEDPDRGMGFSRKREKGKVGEQHLLAVSNLAIVLGQALSLPDGALSDLGVAAMLHDSGFTQLAVKTGHEDRGAGTLARQRGFHEAKVRRILALLEHHLPYDRRLQSGYKPDGFVERPHPSLFARIIRIVDDYDVLTTHRPGQKPPLSPAVALSAMWAERGTQYDPHLLALFVQIMGRYPPGTLLELDDKRWAVSISGARDASRFAWPLVRIVRDSRGEFLEEPDTYDLFLFRHLSKPPKVLDPREDI